MNAVHHGLEIGPWRPGDERSICSLFRRTFGRDKSIESWRWEFLGQGVEPHVMVARDDDGEVVAHFGAVPRRVLLDGMPVTFTVAVDSMVAPERRAGLKRSGLFAAVVGRWVDHFCARGPVQLGYGLANREAFRIGSRLLGYTQVAGAALYARRLPEAPPVEADADVAVRDDLPPDLDLLWERSAARLGVAACRDARFMQWRYQACPDGGFEFITVRRRWLRAFGVFKARYAVPDSATLVDLLWDGADPADLAACVRSAEARAGAQGLHHLAVLLPAAAREAVALAGLGYRPVQVGLTLVGRSFRRGLDLQDLAPRLFYTCGDFDLV